MKTDEMEDVEFDSDEDKSEAIRKRLRVTKTVRRGARYENARCKLCGATYARKTRLKEHMMKKHEDWWADNKEKFCEENNYKIKTNNSDSPNPNNLKPKNISKCEICEEEFTYFKTKVAHQETLHPDYYHNRCKNDAQYARMANRNTNVEKAEKDPDIIKIDNPEGEHLPSLWQCLLCEKKK